MSGFWSWALEAYARPGVAGACLTLQDAHGQSVPFLLWTAWAASQGRAVSDETLAQGAALARRWEAAAVSPLRQARRALKSPTSGVGDAAREALRTQVKAVELKAEQALMLALEGMTGEGVAPSTVGPALARALAAWGGAVPENALLDLAAALA